MLIGSNVNHEDYPKNVEWLKRSNVICALDIGEQDLFLSSYDLHNFSNGLNVTRENISVKHRLSYTEYLKNKQNVYDDVFVIDGVDLKSLNNIIDFTKTTISILNGMVSDRNIHEKSDANYLLYFSKVSKKLSFTKDYNYVEWKTFLNDFSKTHTSMISLKKDKSGIVYKLFNFCKKLYKAHKDARRTTYQNQHQFDFFWLSVVDNYISLIKRISYVGGESEKIDLKNFMKYRDGVRTQFNHEIAVFCRDFCETFDSKILVVEKLDPKSYIGSDTNDNKRRSLLAPAEIKKTIKTTCNLFGIVVAEVREDMTSQIAPNDTIGWRDWTNKKLHYIDNGELKSVHPDYNACDNIVKRFLSSHSDLVQFNIGILKSLKTASSKSKELSNVYAISSLMRWLACDDMTDKEFVKHFKTTFLESVLKQVGKTNSQRCYYYGGKFVSLEQKKSDQEEIRSKVFSSGQVI